MVVDGRVVAGRWDRNAEAHNERLLAERFEASGAVQGTPDDLVLLGRSLCLKLAEAIVQRHLSVR